MVGATFTVTVPVRGIAKRGHVRVISTMGNSYLQVAFIDTKTRHVLGTSWIKRSDIDFGILAGSVVMTHHPGCSNCKATLSYEKAARKPAEFVCPSCGHREPLS